MRASNKKWPGWGSFRSLDGVKKRNVIFCGEIDIERSENCAMIGEPSQTVDSIIIKHVIQSTDLH